MDPLTLSLALIPLPWWLKLPDGVSSFSGRIDGMFSLILWITGVIFVVVEALLVFFLWRYRYKEGRQVVYTHGNNKVEVIWTIVPAVICVVLALMSRQLWAELKQNMPPGAMPIGIEAEQFAWNIHYPGPDGQLFTADDLVTLNQLHIPVGKAVVVTLRSKDVIHSFFLPEFRVKQDAVPGMTTKIWFDGNTVGHWEIACAELCGLGHYRMKGFIAVDAQEDYDKWMAEQVAAKEAEDAPAAAPAPAPAPASASASAPANAKQEARKSS
jgi:cytochrome c oxidase subunit 2